MSTKAPAKKSQAAERPKVATAKTSKNQDIAARIASGPQLDFPDGDPRNISPRSLLLDPHNLRLLEQTRDTLAKVKVTLFGQAPIQAKLHDLICATPRYDIDGLVNSITNNGFLKHERLIVAKYDGDKFLVLEGNRRLTAVRRIYEVHGPDLSGLRPRIRESLQELPCLVLDGPAIADSESQLEQYRRAAEVYIGMRHLMGAKDWDPAARYEFLSRLIFKEKWSISDVVNHFGRTKTEVLRDLKAQVLYQDFLKFESKHKLDHSPTYNAFSEAARAPSIYRWLGWSDKDISYREHERKEIFFNYLISRMPSRSAADSPEIEEGTPEISAEWAVRRLRDYLALGDPRVEGALLDRDFKAAEVLFEGLKEGAFSKKLQSITNSLRRTTTDELLSDPIAIKVALAELAKQVDRMLKLVNAIDE